MKEQLGCVLFAAALPGKPVSRCVVVHSFIPSLTNLPLCAFPSITLLHSHTTNNNATQHNAAGIATDAFVDFVVGHGELWSAQLLAATIRQVGGWVWVGVWDEEGGLR